ncbi:hypothetical protein Tco_1002699 [Tanacetum coccineum]|uniref:Uncharacterized protein n=1 Tax=Tanacetum coccineum TaxID=301880 RepID=A0ABQ5F6Z4_9ASTR
MRTNNLFLGGKGFIYPSESWAFLVQIQELQAQILLLKSQNQKLEQDKEKAAAKIATLKAQSVFPNINQLTEHLVSSMKPKFSKCLSSHDFNSSNPTELKELPIKITALSGEKLETFSSTVSSLTTQVAKLKKHTWELPKEFLSLPDQISSIQTHIKTVEALPGLLSKVTYTLNMFASILNAHNKGIPSTGESTASPVEGEKNTNPITEDEKMANLINLMCIDVVEEYYKKKSLYNKYCEKMLKRKESPKITNCEVLTKKGPIILKIYREDGPKEVISNLKVSDLHLAEWREVIQACPDKSKKGWKTIYGLVKTRLDQLTQTEQELKIDLKKPSKNKTPE